MLLVGAVVLGAGPLAAVDPETISLPLAFAAGATVVAQVAVGLALVAALLNAVFAFCLGCEVYLLVRRFIATV